MKTRRIDRREFMATTGVALAAAGAHGAPLEDNDPLGVRDDFPAAQSGVYLNSPYITPSPRAVEEAGTDFVRSKSRDPIPLGAMLEKTDEVRASFASLFGADTDEVSFLFATSEGENVVAAALGLSAGDNIVIDDLHYETTYVLYKTLEKRKGIEIRIAPSRGGRADAEHFEPYVDGKTRIVSVSWVSHQNGFRHDLNELAALAHSRGAHLYADGIQALGMFDTNLHDAGVDYVTAGTYKWLLGGFGVAPFYVRGEHLDRIVPDRYGSLGIKKSLPDYEFELFDTARKYEYATLGFGAVYQLGAALRYLEKVGLARIEEHTVGLARYLRQGLVDQGFEVRTPPNNGSSIVAFIHGKPSEDVEKLFERERVKVSFRENGSQIRAGVALFNNKADVDRFLETTESLKKL